MPCKRPYTLRLAPVYASGALQHVDHGVEQSPRALGELLFEVEQGVEGAFGIDVPAVDVVARTGGCRPIQGVGVPGCPQIFFRNTPLAFLGFRITSWKIRSLVKGMPIRLKYPTMALAVPLVSALPF